MGHSIQYTFSRCHRVVADGDMRHGGESEGWHVADYMHVRTRRDWFLQTRRFEVNKSRPGELQKLEA